MESLTITSVKDLVESNASIPSKCHYNLEASMPVIDFSLFTSREPQLHALGLQQLAKASAEWNFFMLINHGISDTLIQDVINKSLEFHNLPWEEKKKFSNQDLFAPIRYGTGSDYSQSETCREYLKVITFPEFNFPQNPSGFREVGFAYCEKMREITKVLLRAISESLGLHADAILNYSGFEHCGLQKFQVNLYPPSLQADVNLGLQSHTDTGFLTFLNQNGVRGLQIKRKGKWMDVNPVPGSIIVIPSDQLELVTNGRYKSIWHKVVVNTRETRVSLSVNNGPPLEKEIAPLPELVKKEMPLFKSIKYKDYILLQQKARNTEGRVLDGIRN